MARAQAMFAAGPIHELVCELAGEIDLSVVDSLARLQLLARRHRVPLRVRVHSGNDELSALLCYLGLAEAIAGDSS